MTIKKSSQTNIILPAAPLWRKFAALIYDIFILFSFIIFATTLALIVNQGGSFLPIRYFFLGYLFISTGGFITWFWKKSGQTLGMLSWRIKLVDKHYQPLTWSLAVKRYLYCVLTLFGSLGLLWSLIDKDKQSLQDRLTGTRMVLL